MMQGSVASEWVNGVWAVSALICALVLGDYVRREMLLHPFYDPLHRPWYRRLRVHLAISMALWALGDSVARGVLWRFRHLVNDGFHAEATAFLDSYWWLLIVGACFATAGIVMAVRAVTVERCGNKIWIACGFTAILVQAALDIFS